MTYTLQASGPGGSSQAVQTVNVSAVQPTATPVPPTATPVPPTATPVPPTATPVPPTPTPIPPTATPVPQPEISNFTVQPGEITLGQCVTAAWNTGGGTGFTRLLRDGAVIQDNGPLNSSVQDCPGNAGTVTYQLQAINAAGTVVSQDARVNVIQPQPTNTPVPPVPPLQGFWNLVQLNGQSLVPGTVINANFDNGQVSGNGGCNTFNATYTTNGNNVSISYPVGTQIACPPEVLDQENAFFQALSSVATYQISGPNLAFNDGGGATVLVFSGAR
jgi:heat shock protein HslJ